MASAQVLPNSRKQDLLEAGKRRVMFLFDYNFDLARNVSFCICMHAWVCVCICNSKCDD